MLDFVFRKGETVDVRRASARDQLHKQGVECTDACIDDLLRRVAIHQSVDDSEYEGAYGYQNATIFQGRPSRIAVIPQPNYSDAALEEDPVLKALVEEWTLKMLS